MRPPRSGGMALDPMRFAAAAAAGVARAKPCNRSSTPPRLIYTGPSDRSGNWSLLRIPFARRHETSRRAHHRGPRVRGLAPGRPDRAADPGACPQPEVPPRVMMISRQRTIGLLAVAVAAFGLAFAAASVSRSAAGPATGPSAQQLDRAASAAPHRLVTAASIPPLRDVPAPAPPPQPTTTTAPTTSTSTTSDPAAQPTSAPSPSPSPSPAPAAAPPPAASPAAPSSGGGSFNASG